MTTKRGRGPGPELWRRLALGLFVLGSAGTLTELLFLEHFEDAMQWTPMALLGLGMLAGIALGVRSTPAVIHVFRALMVVYLLAAGLGVYFHLNANVEFERELNPEVGGTELVSKVLKGAMPALAPGAMAQLGLLGLLLCFRHPSISAGVAASRRKDEIHEAE